MSEILKVKIPRLLAGLKIPYDLMYLITRDQRELVHKLWDFALVMPFEESFQKVVFELYPKHFSKLGHYRNDAELRQPIYTGPAPDSTSYTNVKRTARKNIAVSWWATLNETYDLTERLVVVPLLLRRDHERLLPRYLGAKKWVERQIPQASIRKRGKSGVMTADVKLSAPDVAKIIPPISGLAYLATPYEMPNDKLRPLCSICPRSFQHLQGQCVPGMAICYTSLDITNLLTDKKKLTVLQDSAFAQSGPEAMISPPIYDEEIPF